MSAGFETPSHEALLTEQASAQADKQRSRLLYEYNCAIFPGEAWHLGSAMADFVEPFVAREEKVLFKAVLRGLHESKPEHPLSWVDMGGGRGVAMRQLARLPGAKPWLQMTNVDLFDWGLEDLPAEEIEYLESVTPGITRPENAPKLLISDAETVTLPAPANVITSVESIQYFNNPLAALANWYNQLADNGVVFIAAEHDWAYRVRYSETSNMTSRHDETPTGHLLETLSQTGVNFAAVRESDRQDGYRPAVKSNSFCTMAIQKKAGTLLRVSQPVAEVTINTDDKYKAVYYKAPNDGAALIEVVSS
ncbi:MAG TPA: methyltransferase domain-containing protein [Candidatus Saccharimonadales bacterium]|nr:methyltransferase domain-containing protein [Candidatus Saccharimonadales bacterium]